MSEKDLLVSVNPATGETVQTWNGQSDSRVMETAECSMRAWKAWRETTHDERAQALESLARLLEKNRASLAVLMALEMGKPVTQGRAEADKCALVCRYYASRGKGFLADIPVATEASSSYVRHEPVGVIYGVMPWNFPLWQVFRFAAPAVAAGNGVLLKHSPNVNGCAREIVRLFEKAGFPPGLPGLVEVSAARAGSVSRMLIESPFVSAVTLTGGTAAGRAVGAMAGSALKKCVLELGGSDPAIILEDANLEHAAAMTAHSRLINAGQNCIASKRMIVVRSVHARFVELLAATMVRAVQGDPLLEDTTLGPMAREDLREAIHRQVAESVSMGAVAVAGGEVPQGQGFFYPATVLDGVKPGMPVADEETFGPVAAVLTATDENHALELAGQTCYGLGASVFTGSVSRGREIAERLYAGACFVNTFVRSDPRLPFGGIMASGFGRELGRQGMMEFVNEKTVWIEEG